MGTINNVAVIGSGVMGAAIAAHIANSGVPVTLLDIIPEGATDRNVLAKGAVDKLLTTDPAPLTHKRNAKRITPGNLEDDIDRLQDADWIIEAIIERKDIKQSLYKKIDAVRKPGSVVSSNTSTLPLSHLVEGMDEIFCQDFMIVHFFNPPRYMRLIELVTSENTLSDAIDMIRNFCDVKLGKEVVDCNDTPGFIANRIGCYWIAAAVKHAFAKGVSVEEADAVMGRPVGIPKTGVFGLMDLVGIDLMRLIAQSFSNTLPKEDLFIQDYSEPETIAKMIDSGYTGRKGKGGFYRLNKEGGKKIKEAKNLKTGEYAPASKVSLLSVKEAKNGLHALVTHPDIGGQYAWEVLRDTLRYAASLVPDIADDIVAVDDAMRCGYNWKYGPFELIDRLGNNNVSGTKWFSDKLKEEGLPIPDLLINAGDNSFYKIEEGKRLYLTTRGEYAEINIDPTAFTLADIKLKNEPLLKNPSAKLWDIGSGIACLEYTSKMNTMDPMSFEMIEQSINLINSSEGKYKGLVIGNDADNFCAGANIGLALFTINTGAYKMVEEFVEKGQKMYMALKYAPFPVVAAPSGLALGGGCEVLLHADAVQAHVETYTGLVEVGVGLIPGWGGCKEMAYRHLEARAKKDSVASKFGNWFSFISPIRTLNTMPALTTAFTNISTAKIAKSAEEAKDMLILNDKSRITMNRKRLLADAKELCLSMADNYTTPAPAHPIHLPGKTARAAFNMGVKNFAKQGKATPYDVIVSTAVGAVLSGGNTDITKEVTEQDLLDLEREEFNKLLRKQETLDRIEHMLETGKPLRN